LSNSTLPSEPAPVVPGSFNDPYGPLLENMGNISLSRIEVMPKPSQIQINHIGNANRLYETQLCTQKHSDAIQSLRDTVATLITMVRILDDRVTALTDRLPPIPQPNPGPGKDPTPPVTDAGPSDVAFGAGEETPVITKRKK
jgi:hypothetical protein